VPLNSSINDVRKRKIHSVGPKLHWIWTQ